MPDKIPQVEPNFISADIKHLARPIAEMRMDPNNVRKHSRDNIRAIAKSLRVFGQQTPLKIMPDGLILKGNGTFQAAQELGWTSLAASVFDVGQERANGYAVQDNKAGDLATWDYEALSAKIPEMLKQYDLGAMGWKDYELEPLLQVDWTPPAVQPMSSVGPGEGGGPTDVKELMVCFTGAQLQTVMNAVSKFNAQGVGAPADAVAVIVSLCDDFLAEGE